MGVNGVGLMQIKLCPAIICICGSRSWLQSPAGDHQPVFKSRALFLKSSNQENGYWAYQ